MKKAHRFSIILLAFAVWVGVSLACGSATPTSELPKISTATSELGVTQPPADTPNTEAPAVGVSAGGEETAARVLSAQDVFEVSAVNAVETDGYTVTSAVCEVVSPMSYRPSSSVFGGQLVFHAFRLTGTALDSEAVVLFGSNHTAANGSGLVFPVNAEAISLNQGFPAGSSLADPVTVDTPGAQTALACARQVGKPDSLELGNFDVEAWRREAIKKFGPEQTNPDGSKDDYVRFALSICKLSNAERATMQANLGAGYEGSFQQFVIETFCSHV